MDNVQNCVILIYHRHKLTYLVYCIYFFVRRTDKSTGFRCCILHLLYNTIEIIHW
jgi:hypothetical protein